jgi:hypothetical protein
VSTTNKILLGVGIGVLVIICLCSGVFLTSCSPSRGQAPAPGHTVYVVPTSTRTPGYTSGRTPIPRKTSPTKRTPTPKITKKTR